VHTKIIIRQDMTKSNEYTNECFMRYLETNY